LGGNGFDPALKRRAIFDRPFGTEHSAFSVRRSLFDVSPARSAFFILPSAFKETFPIARMAAVLPGIRDNSLAGAFGCDGENDW